MHVTGIAFTSSYTTDSITVVVGGDDVKGEALQPVVRMAHTS